jgi:hypothetical protein
VRANGEFIALTEQRAVSYWSCYYRDRFARREYPAIATLDSAPGRRRAVKSCDAALLLSPHMGVEVSRAQG